MLSESQLARLEQLRQWKASYDALKVEEQHNMLELELLIRAESGMYVRERLFWPTMIVILMWMICLLSLRFTHWDERLWNGNRNKWTLGHYFLITMTTLTCFATFLYMIMCAIAFEITF